MNNQQYENSQQAIARMIERMEERMGNAIHSISSLDFYKGTQADYINGIDAIMIDCTGSTYKLQFKSRQTGNDICIELAIVPQMTAVSHEYKNKNFLVNTKAADIFIQELNGSTTFIYTALQLHTMAQYDEFWNNPIHQNREGQYLLFITQNRFQDFLLEISRDVAIG